jgi:hypothetical protein
MLTTRALWRLREKSQVRGQPGLHSEALPQKKYTHTRIVEKYWNG